MADTAQIAAPPHAVASPVAPTLPEGRDVRALHRLIFLGLAAVLIGAPFAFYPVFLMKVLCFGLFALAFNLLLGYGGLLSFGHAAYFGMASYVCAYAAKAGLRWDALHVALGPADETGRRFVDVLVPINLAIPPLSPELSILAGTCVAALLGLVFGALAIRRQGIYFAMITLALAQMAFFFSLQARFTGGEDGIQAVPRGALFGTISLADDRAMYGLTALVFLGGLMLIYRIIHSPFGQVLKAIRDNEPRAVSLGYRVNQYKLAVFVLSATLAGLAGATKALVFQLASLTDVHWSMSGEVVLMTLVGGMGTVFGPIVGALVIVAMETYLAPLGAWVTVIQGTVFVVCVLLFREGVVGLIQRAIGKPL